jgi:predicted nucleic acid-binding protein
MSLICFDTMIVVWGIQGWANNNQDSMIKRAKQAIINCQEGNHKIIIPSIVLAEILSGIDTEKRKDFHDLVSRNFLVIPFDTLAALEFANLWDNKVNRDKIKSNLDDKGIKITRAEMKADLMIISTAKSKKSEFIYSHDEKFISCAEGIIDVKYLPEIIDQKVLDL